MNKLMYQKPAMILYGIILLLMYIGFHYHPTGLQKY